MLNCVIDNALFAFRMDDIPCTGENGVPDQGVEENESNLAPYGLGVGPSMLHMGSWIPNHRHGN